MLLPSSSVRVVSAMLGGGMASAPGALGALVALACWISYVMSSVLSVARMFVVAVGRRARTVKVQSS